MRVCARKRGRNFSVQIFYVVCDKETKNCKKEEKPRRFTEQFNSIYDIQTFPGNYLIKARYFHF